MPLYALPTIAEQQFSSYLAANYTGTFPIVKAFSSTPYSSPMILVKAGAFKEIEPFTSVYSGSLSVAVFTQIDDAADDSADALALHDETTGFVYQYLNTPDALLAYVNASENNFGLFAYYCTSYDQDRDDRSWKSILTYSIQCQGQSFS